MRAHAVLSHVKRGVRQGLSLQGRKGYNKAQVRPPAPAHVCWRGWRGRWVCKCLRLNAQGTWRGVGVHADCERMQGGARPMLHSSVAERMTGVRQDLDGCEVGHRAAQPVDSPPIFPAGPPYDTIHHPSWFMVHEDTAHLFQQAQQHVRREAALVRLIHHNDTARGWAWVVRPCSCSSGKAQRGQRPLVPNQVEFAHVQLQRHSIAPKSFQPGDNTLMSKCKHMGDAPATTVPIPASGLPVHSRITALNYL